jgi:hypothetical protein
VPLRNVAVIDAGETDPSVGMSIPTQLLTTAGEPIMEGADDLVQASAPGRTVAMMTSGQRDATRVLLRPGGSTPAPGEARHPRTPVRLSPFGVEPAHAPGD